LWFWCDLGTIGSSPFEAVQVGAWMVTLGRPMRKYTADNLRRLSLVEFLKTFGHDTKVSTEFGARKVAFLKDTVWLVFQSA
jgi:hypothetical protein